MQKNLCITKLAVAAPLACALVLTACSKSDSGPGRQPPRNTAAEGGGRPAGAPPFADLQPKVGGAAGYAGSQTCRECHEDEYASWHRSYHRTMTQLPSAAAVQADFHGVVLTNDGVRFALSQTNDEFWVRMERPGAGEPGGSPGEFLDTRLGLVTGSHHMQVFWVPAGQGNAQIGFPFTWLIPEKRWVPRKSTFIRPPDAAHLSEVWNLTCSRCHTTAVEPRVNPAAHTAETRAAELGIACEACHGPGERHALARRAGKDQGAPKAAALRAEIVHPRRIDPARASQICGFCHSMKWFDQSENWRDHGFRYRPGDELEATTPIIRPSRIDAIPGLARYLERHPELLQDYFWADGMVRVSGRDYNGLIESPCYKGGKFSCLSCHSLHESEPDGQLARQKDGNGACTQCHPQFNEPSNLTAHTRHAAGSTGSECLNCHMPRTTYGVLKAIRSHQISSPKVADELATGRPNACNLCHLDKSLAWTAEWLRGWHGQDSPAAAPESRDVSDAVRLALRGDAGQRALVAWHLGWGPALDISGRSWIAPVLAQLLDDPYSAVRCIAERSLRRTSSLVPANYDFALPVESRSSPRAILIEQWKKQTAPEAGAAIPTQTLVRWADPEEMQRRFDRLLQERDDRPVRLRE